MFEIIFFVVVLLSAVFHEYMHGWAANEMGDPTAKNLGRLTLNPIPHIDPVFTIVLPISLYILSAGQFVFAAAKPVPFNPYNLRYPKYGPALVGLAGPIGNLLIAGVFSLLLHFLPLSSLFLTLGVIVIRANVILAIFNLVPIPPLDGSHVLLSLIPPHLDWLAEWLQRYGIILFVVFLAFFSNIISPLIDFLTYLFLRGL